MQRSEAAARHPLVLVVDDDEDLAGEILRVLDRYEFYGTAVHDWDSARHAIVSDCPDAIILDQRLGRFDVLPRLHELRQLTSVPVLIYTSNQDEADRIVGLEMGADDFLVKPVSGRELVARLRAHLRRAQRENAAAGTAAREWELDIQGRRLIAPTGRPVAVTAAEFELLNALAAQPGVGHSREDLTRIVFGRRWDPDDRAVDNLVTGLRGKLAAADPSAGGQRCIATIRTVGYMFLGFP